MNFFNFCVEAICFKIPLMAKYDLFTKCNLLLESELRMRVDSEDFRVWIVMAGWRRFEVAVKATRLWMRPKTTKAEAYAQLMKLLKLMTPPKTEGTKYRNAMTEHGRNLQANIDAEMMGAIARD